MIGKKITLLILTIGNLTIAQDGIKPIIDVHVHGYTEETYKVIEGSPQTFEAFNKEMRKMFRKYNIRYAIKSGGKFDADLEQKMLQGYESNNYPKFDTIQFKKLIGDKKIQVWGEFMPMFNGMTLADEVFDPYLRICELEGVPIALHAGQGPPNIYKRYPKFRLALGDPLLIESVLIKYPKLQVYIMHAGIPFQENTLKLMATYPNVYADLGGVLQSYNKMHLTMAEEFLRKAKDYNMIDRVMFGSDCMYWPDELENSIKKLDSYDFLTEQDKRKIFYDNAFKFFVFEY